MDLQIFSNCINWKAKSQIYTLMDQEPFKSAKVRIMPDCHAGLGCVVGFTSTMTDKVIPNIIGVDIGCGMRVAELGQTEIDLPALDEFIKKKIPAGMAVGTTGDKNAIALINKLICKSHLKNLPWLEASIGSLGGGNHFIEIDKGDSGLYLIVHTGSRNLGKQVAEFYQRLAVCRIKKESPQEIEEARQTIERLKTAGEQEKIPEELEKIKKKYRLNTRIPNELCYLTGEDMSDYIHDMKLCQQFAVLNRTIIVNKILSYLGVGKVKVWESVHNYIDDNNIIRKGAISAHLNERLIIPVNMRDGCIIGIGKGNSNWNESAPHGAGRLMSRGDAKKELSLETYKKEMSGIFSSTVNLSTLDEAPMAYKPIEEILRFVNETIDIEQIIKPIYNFKAGEE